MTTPKRSRKGEVSKPARVVAPTRVKRGKASLMVRALGPLANDNVQLKIFHGRVEDFFDNVRQAVNLVDEKISPCCRLVSSAARSPGRSTTGPDVLLKLTPISSSDDMRQGSFPESWRTAEQDVIDGITHDAGPLQSGCGDFP
mgnify:CR=1 FL=1